jgi:hypothetical protein
VLDVALKLAKSQMKAQGCLTGLARGFDFLQTIMLQ